MEKSHRPPSGNWRDIIFASIAVIVIIIDQLSKVWIKANLTVGQVLWDVGFLQIIHVQNTGVSFGLFKEHTGIIIAVVFIEIVAIGLIVYFFRNRLSFLDSMLMRVGMGLVLGGAIGNQIDRLFFGQVTDFIDFKVWPVWNTADGSAVVGTVIIAFCLLFKSGLMKKRNE